MREDNASEPSVKRYRTCSEEPVTGQYDYSTQAEDAIQKACTELARCTPTLGLLHHRLLGFAGHIRIYPASTAKTSMRRLNAFQAAGSGKTITTCPESLQKAKILLSGPTTDADMDLPTGASWPLQPLVWTALHAALLR